MFKTEVGVEGENLQYFLKLNRQSRFLKNLH